METNECLRCGALYSHVQELNAYIADLHQHVAQLKSQYDERSDSHLVRELTALNHQREATIGTLQQQIQSLQVQNAQLQSDIVRLRNQQPAQAAFRFQSMPSPPRLGPSTVEEALSASMLGAGAGASQALMPTVAGSLSPSVGIASHSVPILSGTQRAAIAGNLHRLYATQGQGQGGHTQAHVYAAPAGQARESTLASSTVHSAAAERREPFASQFIAASDSSPLPAHARRRALTEKEGQSGAAPSHSVLQSGRPGGAGPVPAAALPQVPQQQSKPVQYKPAASVVATGPPAPAIMGLASLSSVPLSHPAPVSAPASSPGKEQPQVQRSPVAASATRLDWATLSAQLPAATADGMNRELDVLRRMQSVLANTASRASSAHAGTAVVGRPPATHALEHASHTGSAAAVRAIAQPQLSVPAPVLKIRPLGAPATQLPTASHSVPAMGPSGSGTSSSAPVSVRQLGGAASMPEPRPVVVEDPLGPQVGGGLSRLNEQIASLRSTIQALQAS